MSNPKAIAIANAAWNVIEEMAVALVTTLLKVVITSPKAYAVYSTVISTLAVLATEADAGVNGNVWTETPATPTPAP